jgi:hypothetical protein
VENRHPQVGEKNEYSYDLYDPQHRGLATIAFLPNLSGKGSLLVVQGFSHAGTQAAAEFVTSGTDLDLLLRAYGGSSAPLPHFEILLSTLEINGWRRGRFRWRGTSIHSAIARQNIDTLR